MGCWKATCGLTQIPITHGDDVRGFFVYVRGFPFERDDPRRDWSGTTYNTELAKPYLLPVRGEYDHYGGIENIQEDLGAYGVRRHFRTPDLDNLVKKVERGAVSRKDIQYNDKTSGIGLFIVLDHFYQSMRDTHLFERYKSDGRLFFEKLDEQDWSGLSKNDPNFMSDEEVEESNLQKDMMDLIMGDQKEDIVLPPPVSKLDEIRARSEKYDEGGDLDTSHLQDRSAFPYIEEVESESDGHNKFKSRMGASPIEGSRIIREAKDRIIDLYVEGKRSSDEAVQSVLDDMCLSFTFSEFMAKARKQWIPGTEKGSQNDYLWPHGHLAVKTAEYLNKIDEDTSRGPYEM